MRRTSRTDVAHARSRRNSIARADSSDLLSHHLLNNITRNTAYTLLARSLSSSLLRAAARVCRCIVLLHNKHAANNGPLGSRLCRLYTPHSTSTCSPPLNICLSSPAMRISLHYLPLNGEWGGHWPPHTHTAADAATARTCHHHHTPAARTAATRHRRISHACRSSSTTYHRTPPPHLPATCTCLPHLPPCPCTLHLHTLHLPHVPAFCLLPPHLRNTYCLCLHTHHHTPHTCHTTTTPYASASPIT